jgi:protein ImuA
MHRNGVSERIALLRQRIAAVEARESPRVSRPSPNRTAAPAARSLLEGPMQDLARGNFTEIIPARPRDAGAAAGFSFTLALCAAAVRPGGRIVWIIEDMAAYEIGLPYGAGLEALGADSTRLIFARTHSAKDTLWAMEEALKSRAAVVIGESWLAPRAYDLTASRRLLLAARRGGGLGLLLLLRACGQAGRMSSAAQLRFEISAPQPPPAPESGGLPLPGPLGWRLRIAKARAGLAASGENDSPAWRHIDFDPDKAAFRYALPQRLPAVSSDGPDSARPRRSSL